MSKPKIFLARPIHYEAEPEHEQSVRRLMLECVKRGVDLLEAPRVGDSLIQRIRNRCVKQFLATDATHLLFVDADIVFLPESVFDLLEADRDVIGGAYVRKQSSSRADDITSYALTLTSETTSTQTFTIERGGIEVQDLATGFMLIKRGVFERMAAAHPEWSYISGGGDDRGQPVTAFFDCYIEPDTREYLSEDYAFCRRWRAMGEKVWCLLDCPLIHIGKIGFHGHLVDAVFKTDFEMPADADIVVRADFERVRNGEYAVPGCPPIASVLDIGANVGAFAMWARDRWPGVHTVCYEPVPAMAAFLRKNVPTAEVVEKALLGPELLAKSELGPTRTRLYPGANCGCSSAYDLGEQNVHEPFEVAAMAAEVVEACEFVKIDAEGAELDILRGMQLGNKLDTAKAVALEYHKADADEIGAFLVNAGFSIVAHEPFNERRGLLKALRA